MNYVFKLDRILGLLYINDTLFEDYPKPEQRAFVKLLFEGGQKRASLEKEVEELEALLQTSRQEAEYHKIQKYLALTALAIVTLTVAILFFLTFSPLIFKG